MDDFIDHGAVDQAVADGCKAPILRLLADGLGERAFIPIRTWSDRAFLHSAKKMRGEMFEAAEKVAASTT